MIIKTLCVFCGSNSGKSAVYSEAAKALGNELAKQNINLVYGGARVGLMADVANSALAAGSKVIGVIPRGLVEKEVAHQGLTQLHIVNTMHERKATMAEMSDGFIAMPGGFGTFEEFFEVVTWSQLQFHSKPCGLLNISGFYEPMLKMIQHSIDEGFIKPEYRELIVSDPNPSALIDKLNAWKAPTVAKWIDKKS